jgi:hypothetical protein
MLWKIIILWVIFSFPLGVVVAKCIRTNSGKHWRY